MSATAASATTSHGRTARSPWSARSRSRATPSSTDSRTSCGYATAATARDRTPPTRSCAWRTDSGSASPTGVDLPSESGGRIADRAWKQQTWEATKETSCRRADEGYPDVADDDPERAAYLQRIASDNCVDGYKYRGGDAVNFAIGQGDTTVTPLQLAVAYGAIANGGTLWAPRIGKAVVRPNGALVEEIVPTPAGTLPVDPATLDYIRTALYGVPREGTARGPFAGFPLDEHPIAAKTGTGEVFGKQTTSWFASFDDRYAVVVMVEQGGTEPLRPGLPSGRSTRRSTGLRASRRCRTACRRTRCPR